MSIKNTIKDIVEQKKEWKAHMARVEALPKEYQIVYKEMQNYLFKVGLPEAAEWTKILVKVVELFEEGAKAGAGVLDVTTGDVAAFCDELLANPPADTKSSLPASDNQVAKALKKSEEAVKKSMDKIK